MKCYPKKEKKVYVIPRRSVKRAKQEREYNREVKIWIVGKTCAVFPGLPATECHHVRGREGIMLLMKEFWLPVSRKGHDWIDNHPDEAREKGFIKTRIK